MKRFKGFAFVVLLVTLSFLTFPGCRQEEPETKPNPSETVLEQAEEPETESEPVKPVGSCVMIGDSITAQGDFQPYFESVTMYNLGISGDTIVGVTERMGQVAEIAPDLLMILCGINSLSDDTLEQCLIEYDLLAESAADLPGEMRIVIQSVLPADEV